MLRYKKAIVSHPWIVLLTFDSDEQICWMWLFAYPACLCRQTCKNGQLRFTHLPRPWPYFGHNLKAPGAISCDRWLAYCRGVATLPAAAARTGWVPWIPHAGNTADDLVAGVLIAGAYGVKTGTYLEVHIIS